MTPIAEFDRLPSLERLGYRETAPPFINGLLQTNRDLTISKNQFKDMVIAADRTQVQSLLDHMNRQIDVTGFVPAFVGLCQTPEEVQAQFDEIAYSVIELLHKEPQELQENIVRTLLAKDYCDSDALLWLDGRHGDVIKELNAKRTPEAEAFRLRNIEAIKQPKNDIVYVPSYRNDQLTQVAKFINVPQLPEENRRILERLTPIFFKRQSDFPDQNPITFVGFMQQFRKAGDPFARVMARVLQEGRKQESFFERISRQA